MDIEAAERAIDFAREYGREAEPLRFIPSDDIPTKRRKPPKDLGQSVGLDKDPDLESPLAEQIGPGSYRKVYARRMHF